MSIKVIITGVTGMVGEGVLHEALNHAEVNEILVINRRPCGVQHPKLKEIIHENFFDLSPIKSQLAGYDACYFCLGVSAVKLNQEQYTHFTYDLTLGFAKTLLEVNANLTFIYVSGAGTDSTEKGSQMWARVKGKTENDLLNLPFKKAYMFRPGFMKPTPGLKNTLSFYKYLNWVTPLLSLFPSFYSTLAEVGQAMIKISLKPYEKNILEVKDIVKVAKG